MRVAGIMSGTSLDGIDVAVIDIDDTGFETAAFHTVPYSDEVRRALLGVSNREAHVGDVARLHFLLPELYAQAFHETCARAQLAPSSVGLIGCHGQTIFHEGTPVEFLGHKIASTLQIGDGSVLAERTGIPVISDFRPRDIAAGGKGAPLVPFVDYLLFRHDTIGRAAVNIGGIANVTLIPAGADATEVLAFDTGPGNMVIDQLVERHTQGAQTYDRGGELARAGNVSPDALETLLLDPFYAQKPPKTCGREQFGGAFLDQFASFGLSPEDAIATATMLTAATIADAIYTFGGGDEAIQEVIVSGGGVHNGALMRMLRAELADLEVLSSADLGLDPDAKEAIAFAILAHETWHNRPSNLPSATGAKRAVVLGKLSK